MKKSITLLCLKLLFLQILSAQSVGIGTNTPSEKLDVAGNIKADTLKIGSLKMTANAGTGKVLMSDASGIANWQFPGTWVAATNGLSRKADSIQWGWCDS